MKKKRNEKNTKTKTKLHKKSAKKRTAIVRAIRKTRPTPKKKSKLVSKTSKVHKRGTPEQLRNNPRPEIATKSSRGFKDDTKRRKAVSKVQSRSNPKLPETNEVTVTHTFRTNKEGKRIKQTAKILGKEKSVGYRENFNLDLSGGDLNSKIERLKNSKFDWFNKPFKKFRPNKVYKAPQAVVIKIITKAGNQVYYSGGISDPSFVVNKENTKQLIIDKINEYRDNWINRVSGKFATGVESIKGKKRMTKARKKAAAEASQQMEEEGYELEAGEEVETTSSYKAIFDPNNIAGVSLSFIY